MEEKRKIRIGISLGDINGIGPEVVLKALADERLYKFCNILVYGNSTALNYHKKLLKNHKTNFQVASGDYKLHAKQANLVECGDANALVNVGQPSDFSGKLALEFLDNALKDIADKKIDALVTAPLNKSTIKISQGTFYGHTEYIQNYCNMPESLMLMTYNDLRVGLATNHLPLEKVSAQLNSKQIIKKLELLNQTLKQDFSIEKPKIAVLSLNPHAGDNGLLGKEEETIIIPAIQKAKEQNILAFGVYAADGFFGNGQQRHFDGVLAMYHDQGLIPFKAISFNEGVNFTAGLPIVRTSPDHGTAYDIAGKDEADPTSMLNAIYTAIDIARSRENYTDARKNSLYPVKKSNAA